MNPRVMPSTRFKAVTKTTEIDIGIKVSEFHIVEMKMETRRKEDPPAP